jgi:hypothetical protein
MSASSGGKSSGGDNPMNRMSMEYMGPEDPSMLSPAQQNQIQGQVGNFTGGLNMTPSNMYGTTPQVGNQPPQQQPGGVPQVGNQTPGNTPQGAYNQYANIMFGGGNFGPGKSGFGNVPQVGNQPSGAQADNFYNSPEYKNLSAPGGAFGGAASLNIYNSPYFGQQGSGSIGRAQDQAYEAYLKRTGQQAGYGLGHELGQERGLLPFSSYIPQYDPRLGGTKELYDEFLQGLNRMSMEVRPTDTMTFQQFVDYKNGKYTPPSMEEMYGMPTPEPTPAQPPQVAQPAPQPAPAARPNPFVKPPQAQVGKTPLRAPTQQQLQARQAQQPVRRPAPVAQPRVAPQPVRRPAPVAQPRVAPQPAPVRRPSVQPPLLPGRPMRRR